MIAAAGSGPSVDVGGPGAGVSGVVGEAGDGGAQAVIAGAAEEDATALAGLVGDRAHAGFGGELTLAWEALAHVIEFGKDLSGADTPGAREGHNDLAIRQFGDGVFDARG